MWSLVGQDRSPRQRATHRLLARIGTLQPFTWLNSASDTSICSGRRGAHTVSCSWALRCRKVKFTCTDCLPLISLPLTRTASHVGDTCRVGGALTAVNPKRYLAVCQSLAPRYCKIYHLTTTSLCVYMMVAFIITNN